jgi:hypothetical protein
MSVSPKSFSDFRNLVFAAAGILFTQARETGSTLLF